MATVAELLADAAAAGEQHKRDAEILLSHCLDKPHSWLYTWPENVVAPAVLAQFTKLKNARHQGTPIAYLTGRRGFWTLNLQVNEHTLIPRPETELLVEWALELALPPAAGVLDLGTGSGAIALALASEKPLWNVSAIDASELALEVARANAAELKLGAVQFFRSNWYEALVGRQFDLLISNPPYISHGDIHLSQGDLRYEPVSALRAGRAGFADLAEVIEGAPAHLNNNAYLLLEHGYQQAAQVRDMLRECGFSKVESRCDLAGVERASGGCWNAE